MTDDRPQPGSAAAMRQALEKLLAEVQSELARGEPDWMNIWSCLDRAREVADIEYELWAQLHGQGPRVSRTVLLPPAGPE